MKKILYLSFFLPSLMWGNSKVSNLTETTTPKTTDYMYIVANSSGMKVQISALLSLSGASTSYIQNRNTLQTGTTAYPDFIIVGSSLTSKDATISTATIKQIRWSDGSVQVSSASTYVPLFNYSFDPDQAKLPGAGTPYIQNSTNAFSSSVLFDQGSTQTVTWSTILSPYNNGTLNADIFYTVTGGSTGTVNFGIYVACITPADAVAVDSKSFGTLNSTSTTIPGTAGYLQKATVALTNGDSCAANDVLGIKLERTAGTLDTAVNAEFRKLRIWE